MDGLLIEFDLKSGRRAGNINPKDPGLKCYGWQNLDEEDINARGYVWQSGIPAGSRALEIRVVEDGRDISQYEGIAGVTILKGKDAINEAIDSYMPEQFWYRVEDQALFQESVRQKGIKLDQFKGRKAQEVLKELAEIHGVVGIGKVKRYSKV